MLHLVRKTVPGTGLIPALAALVLVASLASVGLARPPKGTATKAGAIEGPISLVKQKAVQKELRLTAKQVRQLARLAQAAVAKQKADRQRFLARSGGRRVLTTYTIADMLRERRRVELPVVEAMLTPRQRKRYTEIRWQLHGPALIPLVVGEYSGPWSIEPALVRTLNLKTDQLGKLTPLVGDPTMWKDVREKFVALLSDAQKQKWKNAIGAPFKP